MRLLRLYRAFMTTVRPILRSSDRVQWRACGAHQQTKIPMQEFMGLK
jgi:hypothetical protein